MSQPTGTEIFHPHWQAYARWRRVALSAVFLWPVICVLVFALSRRWLHGLIVSGVAASLWLAGALALVWWQGEFRCPGCKRRYGALGNQSGRKNWTCGIFDEVCSNCKLRKFE